MLGVDITDIWWLKSETFELCTGGARAVRVFICANAMGTHTMSHDPKCSHAHPARPVSLLGRGQIDDQDHTVGAIALSNIHCNVESQICRDHMSTGGPG